MVYEYGQPLLLFLSLFNFALDLKKRGTMFYVYAIPLDVCAARFLFLF